MCCVCVHLHVCLSQLCHSSEQQNVEVGLLHVCSPKLCYSKTLTLLLLLSPPSTFFSLPVKSTSVYSSTCYPYPVSITSFTSLYFFFFFFFVFRPLSYFLTHSHTHSSVFQPLLPSLSFSLPPNQSHMLEREARGSEDGPDCGCMWRVWYSVVASRACICV